MLSARSIHEAKNEASCMEKFDLLRKSASPNIILQVDYIPEMYKRCPVCNSKLTYMDAENQEISFLFFNGDIDYENSHKTNIYYNDHEVVRCSNKKCGFKNSYSEIKKY